MCKKHATFSNGSLRRMVKNKSIGIHNVCEETLGILPQDIISAREAFASGTSRKRQHTPRVVFTPDVNPKSGNTTKKTPHNIQLNPKE